MYGCVLAAGACAAWYFGVRPIEQRFNDGAAELKGLNAQLAQFDQVVSSEPPLDGVIDALTTKGRRTNRATQVTASATHLYDTIRDLANSTNVKLARVEPSTARAVKAGGDKGLKGAEVFGQSIEVSGTYESVCKFIEACEHSLGVTKVASFHISVQSSGMPIATTSKDPILTAIIETTHLKMTIPKIGTDGPTRSVEANEEKGS
jgi:hypothetical protein